MKKLWIYQVRGLAIIAVVVCHQLGILHDTENIQLLTLYSVTTLVFLMGVTKALSLEKHYSASATPPGIFLYSIKSMVPTICSYIVATFLYLCFNSGSGWVDGGNVPYSTVLTNILDFTASGPFYFIGFYILLSLWAPFLYSIIKYIIYKNISIKYKLLQGIFVFILIWLIGYKSIGKMELFGESYLFVYACGLLIGQVKAPILRKVYFIPAFILLAVGFISTKRFYWARIAGTYNYSEGVNFFTPKLQLNPPNVSIILYSFGVIAVAYLVFEFCNNSKISFIKWIVKPLSVLGKYSMDIFLWHLLIRNYLNRYFFWMEKNVFKWIIYYCSMFIIPILVRCLYNKVKSKTYDVLKL